MSREPQDDSPCPRPRAEPRSRQTKGESESGSESEPESSSTSSSETVEWVVDGHAGAPSTPIREDEPRDDAVPVPTHEEPFERTALSNMSDEEVDALLDE